MTPQHYELLPCPIPFPWGRAPFSGGSRRRLLRWKGRRALEILVNLEVCALNFCFLSMPRKCPEAGRCGIPRPDQHAMIQSLWERTRSTCRLVGNLHTGSGSKIATLSSELDQLETAISSLQEVVYGSAKQYRTSARSSAVTPVVPTVAQKVAFPQELKGFDPVPFLPSEYRVAFCNPNKFITGDMPGPSPCIFTSSRSELRHLFWRWDKVDRLCLALEGEFIDSDVSNLFCLAKPDGELRQIIDRRRRNSRELAPPKDGPKMGHASSFLGLIIPPGGCLRGCVDDLRNFYHEFEVPLERALSTPVGPEWCVRDWTGSKALAALRARHGEKHRIVNEGSLGTSH